MDYRKRPESYKRKVAVYAIEHGMTKASHKFNLSRTSIERYKNQFIEKNPRAYQEVPSTGKPNGALRYTPEQKAEAVRTALSESVREASKHSGASEVSVRTWIKQAAEHGMDFLELQKEEKKRFLRRTKKNNPKQRYLYSQDEVAEYLGLTQTTVNRLIKNGEIKGERVGGGKERIYLIFPFAEIDRYHLARIKKKLGKKFKDEMVEANFVIGVFQSLGVDIREFKSFVSTIKDSVCPDEKRETLELALVLFQRFHKDVRRWVYNKLSQTPSSDEWIKSCRTQKNGTLEVNVFSGETKQ